MTVRGDFKTLLGAGFSLGLSAALITGVHPPTSTTSTADVRLAAVSQSLPPRVLTLEGGLVGLQHIFHFTPLQLQGALCEAPNVCQPVDYAAIPLGEYFNREGAKKLIEAVGNVPADTPVVPFGHSQGGQVIYAAVRQWTANPATAPDPSRLSWVSIGNPENAFGGVRREDGLPPETPYQGTEVIKQYDGWADWPTGPFNLLAIANAVVGMNTTHVTGYFDVDLDSPDNIRYTPDKADGSPGNITYVFVPNPTLPLIAATGLLAPILNPILDPILRPIIEEGYDRPIGPVGVTPNTAATRDVPESARIAPVKAASTAEAGEPTQAPVTSVEPEKPKSEPVQAPRSKRKVSASVSDAKNGPRAKPAASRRDGR